MLRVAVLFSFLTLPCVIVAFAVWVGYGQEKMNDNLDDYREIEPNVVPNLGLAVSGILAIVAIPIQAGAFGAFLSALKGHTNPMGHKALI